jgi:hypothetical protein
MTDGVFKTIRFHLFELLKKNYATERIFY